MNVELQMLIWSIALGLVQVAIAATGMLGQRGLGFAASPRDDGGTLVGVAGRLERARANFMETFAMFAAVVLAGYVLQRHTATTAL
ncbi:MAG TPA: MAPEG family protein, partial [Dyella sp.]|nr:MAPEG family protein [Dyella sp.]